VLLILLSSFSTASSASHLNPATSIYIDMASASPPKFSFSPILSFSPVDLFLSLDADTGDGSAWLGGHGSMRAGGHGRTAAALLLLYLSSLASRRRSRQRRRRRRAQGEGGARHPLPLPHPLCGLLDGSYCLGRCASMLDETLGKDGPNPKFSVLLPHLLLP